MNVKQRKISEGSKIFVNTIDYFQSKLQLDNKSNGTEFVLSQLTTESQEK